MKKICSIALLPCALILLLMLFITRGLYAQTIYEGAEFSKQDLIPTDLLRIPHDFFEKDSIIIITNNYDLEGRVLDIPDNRTLLFRGGSFHNGRINLGGNTLVDGAKIYAYGNTNYVRGSVVDKQVYYSVSISIIGKDNVKIKNCSFISYGELPQATDIGVMVYGNRKEKASNVIIDSCTFIGCSADFFSNVINCSLLNSYLSSSTHLLSVETLYDKKNSVQYLHPKNITIDGNYFIVDNSNPNEPPLWCSGLENLTFSNNHCESDCNILMLYCGDGNIALDTIRIINNEFIYPYFNANKKNACAISCMGRSFPHMNKEISFGDIEIRNNVFLGMPDHSNLASCRAINSRFVNKILIKDNRFDGFADVIYLGDTFRGINWVTTIAEVVGNTFSYSKGAPLLFESDNDQEKCLMSTFISQNTFFNHKTHQKITKNALKSLKKLKNFKVGNNKFR